MIRSPYYDTLYLYVSRFCGVHIVGPSHADQSDGKVEPDQYKMNEAEEAKDGQGQSARSNQFGGLGAVLDDVIGN